MGRFDSFTQGRPNGGNRRISPIAVRLGEGPMSDHAADVQPERRERVSDRGAGDSRTPNERPSSHWKLTFCEHHIRDPQSDGALIHYAHSGSATNSATGNATRPTARSVPATTHNGATETDPNP